MTTKGLLTYMIRNEDGVFIFIKSELKDQPFLKYKYTVYKEKSLLGKVEWKSRLTDEFRMYGLIVPKMEALQTAAYTKVK